MEFTQSFQFFEHPLGYFLGFVFGFHIPVVRFTDGLRADEQTGPKRKRRSQSQTKVLVPTLLRLCLLFFAATAFVSCPVPYCSFPAVKLQLFLSAVSPVIFVRRRN